MNISSYILSPALGLRELVKRLEQVARTLTIESLNLGTRASSALSSSVAGGENVAGLLQFTVLILFDVTLRKLRRTLVSTASLARQPESYQR